MMRLTAKQETFCLEYIKTGNASEAYRRAYDAKRMKPEAIHVKAAELLNNGKITARGERQNGEVLGTSEVPESELHESRKVALRGEYPKSGRGGRKDPEDLAGDPGIL